MNKKYNMLKIENQLCFPLYACSKEIIKLYKPFLEPLNLTYTQYIAMMVMWDKQEITVKELGDKLYLDSGTLTPVLKKLESKGYVERERSRTDERNLIVKLTALGGELKKEAVSIPQKLSQCIQLKPEEAQELYQILYKILDTVKE